MHSLSFWKIALIILSILFPTVACRSLAFAQPSQILDLHTVDWEKFIENDTHLQHPLPRSEDRDRLQDFYGPYIEIKVDGFQHPVSGYVLSRQVFFVDLSGDGQKEAIIRLNCGGCNGQDHGVLIYTAKNGTPILIGVLAGDDILTESDGNSLVFKEPIYQPYESHCCPSGWATTRYRLIENRIVAVGHSYTLYPELHEDVVQAYYSKLKNKSYREAYQWYLSSSFQAANPYTEWLIQYQHTSTLIYKTSKLSDGSVGVDLIQGELTPSGEVTRHWFAKWKLVATSFGWRLDNVQLEELP